MFWASVKQISANKNATTARVSRQESVQDTTKIPENVLIRSANGKRKTTINLSSSSSFFGWILLFLTVSAFICKAHQIMCDELKYNALCTIDIYNG